MVTIIQISQKGMCIGTASTSQNIISCRSTDDSVIIIIPKKLKNNTYSHLNLNLPSLVSVIIKYKVIYEQ